MDTAAIIKLKRNPLNENLAMRSHLESRGDINANLRPGIDIRSSNEFFSFLIISFSFILLPYFIMLPNWTTFIIYATFMSSVAVYLLSSHVRYVMSLLSV